MGNDATLHLPACHSVAAVYDRRRWIVRSAARCFYFPGFAGTLPSSAERSIHQRTGCLAERTSQLPESFRVISLQQARSSRGETKESYK
jgi:hypothetical protein